MPRAVFVEAARLCGLQRTTYQPTHSWLLESAMIDFRGERDPTAAHKCFNEKLNQADQVLYVNGKMPEHMGYVWDTQT
jgi:hypothetical protein